MSKELSYSSEDLNMWEKGAYYDKRYAQVLTLVRKLWSSERMQLLDKYPRKRLKTVYKNK